MPQINILSVILFFLALVWVGASLMGLLVLGYGVWFTFLK